jgi:hypothetical protein
MNLLRQIDEIRSNFKLAAASTPLNRTSRRTKPSGHKPADAAYIRFMDYSAPLLASAGGTRSGDARTTLKGGSYPGLRRGALDRAAPPSGTCHPDRGLVAQSNAGNYAEPRKCGFYASLLQIAAVRTSPRRNVRSLPQCLIALSFCKSMLSLAVELRFISIDC